MRVAVELAGAIAPDLELGAGVHYAEAIGGRVATGGVEGGLREGTGTGGSERGRPRGGQDGHDERRSQEPRGDEDCGTSGTRS